MQSICQDPLPGNNPPPNQNNPNNNQTLGYDLTIDSLGNIISGIACWAINVVLAVMVVALIIAGLRFLGARGDQTKVSEAKKNFNWVIIGIIVILATNIIIATIAGALGGSYSYLPLSCSQSK